jgi:hypothetical protein
MKHIVLSLFTPPHTASDAIDILIGCSFRALQKSKRHQAELRAFEGSGLILDTGTAVMDNMEASIVGALRRRNILT